MLHNACVHHDPAARPTLRLLAELSEGWADPHERRAVAEGQWDDVQPLSHLSHPILVKSRSLTGTGPGKHPIADRIIACSRGLKLIEVRTSQWRAGVWSDSDGVKWVVAAGLAKGGHRDHEDFYEQLERQCSTERGRKALLPTAEDARLLKRETAARLLTDWEIKLQSLAADLLTEALCRGRYRAQVPHPSKTGVFSDIELELAVEDGVEEINLSFIDRTRPGSQLVYVMERRFLIGVAPPEQNWDLGGGIYSTMEESGHCARQITQLRSASQDHRLLESSPGQVAHRVHRRDIGDACVNGAAVRSLCGVYFVPRTDPAELPECEECARRYEQLPRT